MTFPVRICLATLIAATVVGCASGPQRPSARKAEALEKAIADGQPKESIFSRMRRPRVEAVHVPTWNDAPVKDPSAMKLAYARWMASSGNHPEAVKNYEAVLAMKPDHPEALLGLAKVEAASGNTSAAAARFERIAEVAPNTTDALVARGEFAMMQGRTNEAVDLLSQAVRQKPNDSPLKHRLGIALGRQGRIEEARRIFVATVGPAEAAYQVGMILKDTQPGQAAAEFQAALSMRPTLTGARNELAALNASQRPGPIIRPAAHSSNAR